MRSMRVIACEAGRNAQGIVGCSCCAHFISDDVYWPEGFETVAVERSNTNNTKCQEGSAAATAISDALDELAAYAGKHSSIKGLPGTTSKMCESALFRERTHAQTELSF